jgi:hypothetical protein
VNWIDLAMYLWIPNRVGILSICTDGGYSRKTQLWEAGQSLLYIHTLINLYIFINDIAADLLTCSSMLNRA